MRSRTLYAAALIAFVAAGCSQERAGDERQRLAMTGNLWAELARDPGEQESLITAIAWPHIPALVKRGAGLESATTSRFVELAKTSDHAPAIYLAGLILIGKQRSDLAAEMFARLPVEAIPPNYLYAPFRLAQEWRPAGENRYRRAIMNAVGTGVLPALVDARLLTLSGRFREALVAYLRTDPARWSTRDLSCLNCLYRLGGTRPDCRRMIVAALRANRVEASIKISLRSMIRDTGPTMQEGAKQQKMVEELMGADEVFRSAVIRGYTAQLRIRQMFLARDYSKLLDEHGQQSRFAATDEAVYLLTLAAARKERRELFAIWSSELKRRFPSEDTSKWVRSLMPSQSEEES